MTSACPSSFASKANSVGLEHLGSSDAARAWLAMLRSVGTDHPYTAEYDVLFDGLSKALDRVLAEHAGMSAELLSVYEQLGVIFEVTRNLPSVQSEAGVVDLFVDNLRHSFVGVQVWSVRARRRPLSARALVSGGSSPLAGEPSDPWLQGQIERARECGKVIVERRPGQRTPVDALGDAAPTPPTGGEVMIGPVFAGKEFVCAIIMAQTMDMASFRASDMLLVEALTTFCGDLLRNHRLVSELREMSLGMVRALVNAVDQKDEYTSGHSIRVGYYSTLLGRKLGLDEADLQMLQWSALLHDVGKIGIRDDVLKKPSRLTEEEFRHIQEHPVRSHKVVQQVPQLERALDGILYHHEHYDGGGYPAGLKGENIPLQARIIQIADVFDALTSTRSYRPANDWRGALAILAAEAGRTVDPRLRQVFDELIRNELKGQPEGWPNLIARANQFAQDSDAYGSPSHSTTVAEPIPRSEETT